MWKHISCVLLCLNGDQCSSQRIHSLARDDDEHDDEYDNEYDDDYDDEYDDDPDHDDKYGDIRCGYQDRSCQYHIFAEAINED